MKEEIVKKVEEMAAALVSAKDDAVKFAAGNNSAGTRLRVAMLALKKTAQEIRVDVSTEKKR